MIANRVTYLNHCTHCGHRCSTAVELSRCPRCFSALPPTAANARVARPWLLPVHSG
jgi:hypothetical protein